jgi:hypothetical protein
MALFQHEHIQMTDKKLPNDNLDDVENDIKRVQEELQQLEKKKTTT